MPQDEEQATVDPRGFQVDLRKVIVNLQSQVSAAALEIASQGAMLEQTVEAAAAQRQADQEMIQTLSDELQNLRDKYEPKKETKS